jgi:hypothetical protein
MHISAERNRSREISPRRAAKAWTTRRSVATDDLG